MDFELSSEHRSVRDMVYNFAQKEIAPVAQQNDANHFFDRNILKQMGELGFLGICVPEQYGGTGLDYVSMGILCEEIERAETAFRVLLSVHLGLNSMTLLQWGSEEQKQQFLVPQARGEKIAAFGLTEPSAGSDAAHMKATARRDGNDYILNGNKVWISAAEIADNFLVFANIDPGSGAKGVTAFLLERGMEGLSTGSIKGKLGVHAGNTGEIVMQDVRVPAANRLGNEGEGFKIAMSALDWGRYTVGTGAVGLAQASLDASVKYAREREAFGSAIGKFELVQQMIARMVAGTEAARLLCYRAGWMKNYGMRTTRETSLAKWYACDVALKSADDAIEIHGAYGYSNEYPVERYFRNARGAVLYEGTREIHTIMQGEYALGYREDKPLRCPSPPASGYERRELPTSFPAMGR